MVQKAHLPCPDCGSQNNLTDYDDHTYCFGCHKYTKKETGISNTSLSDRGISDETAKKYGVTVTNDSFLFPYHTRDGRQEIATKHRKKVVKTFHWTGVVSEAGLFGAHLFPPGCDKTITVTEGEFDALAASQMQGNKYPVVSVRNGASGAVKDCTDNFEYLNSFERIVICFDKDEAHVRGDRVYYPGQEAAVAVASLPFPAGKVKILTLQRAKDANDYLVNGWGKEYISEWWDAPTYTPAGILLGSSMWDRISKPKNYETVKYPWEGLNYQTYGLRLSEFVLITAHPKVGKTTFLKEIEHYLLNHTQAGVGFMHFEEPNEDTCIGLMSITAEKPLHLPDVRENVPNEELRSYYDSTINNDRVVIWDHFGSNSIYDVLNKIRHMAALGCKYIVVDHLSIIVSDQSGDERKQLDEISTKIKTLCMELNICVIAVIHQSRSGVIRGSAGPEQLANIVIRLERNKEEVDHWRRNVTKVIVQDNRFCGRTGPACYLSYEGGTGRMKELSLEDMKLFDDGGTNEVWA